MIGTALFLSFAMASENAVEYDCQAEKQIVLQSDEGDWNYSADDVAKENWETFRYNFVVVENAEGQTIVSHDAGSHDILGLGGTHRATKLAPGQFAFSTQKASNCLFTELGCGALVEISDINDQRASFSLTPMGSVKMEDGRREVLQLVMLGTCKKSKS